MFKLMYKQTEGILFIISAPAGTGKTTLASKLIERNPGKIVRSISCTTRPKRGDEVHGREYYFISEAEFDKKIEENAFLEYETVYGARYGTLKSEVFHRNAHVILVIDTKGGLNLMEKGVDAVSIFIAPPSEEEQRARLEKRGDDKQESIDLRLKSANFELRSGMRYNYWVVNDDLEEAYLALCAIMIAEEHKTRRKSR